MEHVRRLVVAKTLLDQRGSRDVRAELYNEGTEVATQGRTFVHSMAGIREAGGRLCVAGMLGGLARRLEGRPGAP